MSAHRSGLIGKKLGMTQVFTPAGDLRPVTAVHAASVVVGHRTVEKDGYSAVRLGYGDIKLKRVSKARLGVFSKAGAEPTRAIREVRCTEADLARYELGKPVPIDSIFKVGTYVDVVGTSKGKGYQGVVKLHHMGGNRATHGTHEFFRHGGSIGCRLTPGRVHRGKRMSSHMGSERTTIQNIPIIEIIADQGLLLLGGALPGGKNGLLIIKNAVKKVGPVKVRGAGELQEKSKNPMKASKAAAGAAKKK